MTFRRILGIVLAVAAIVFCFIIPLVSIFTYSMPGEFTGKYVSVWNCYWEHNADSWLIFQGFGIFLGLVSVSFLATDFNCRKVGWALMAACGVILLYHLATSLAIEIDTWNLDEELRQSSGTFLRHYFIANCAHMFLLLVMLLVPLLTAFKLLEKEPKLPPCNSYPVF